MSEGGFAGLRVLSLESRRSQEMEKLISNFGGRPLVAPSMHEVPLEANTAVFDFASALIEGNIDVVIFLTGVGVRVLTRMVETKYSKEEFVTALSSVPVVARGPKPVAVLREMGVPIALRVPEPNTWREVLHALDENSATLPVKGRTVAVQEYGIPNSALIAGLAERGATVTPVPVYEWTLPDDLNPLRSAIQAVVTGKIDVALFTSSAQVRHLFQVAEGMGLQNHLQEAFEKVMVVSIGPITSEELRAHRLTPTMEPEHPKMGMLVKEAADRANLMLAELRAKAHFTE